MTDCTSSRSEESFEGIEVSHDCRNQFPSASKQQNYDSRVLFTRSRQTRASRRGASNRRCTEAYAMYVISKIVLSSPLMSFMHLDKRPRASEVEDNGGNVEWRWGSRAYSEVGEQAIAEFVASFMAEHSARNSGDDEEGRNRANRNRQEIEKAHDTIMRDITRAAGGKLSEVR